MSVFQFNSYSKAELEGMAQVQVIGVGSLNFFWDDKYNWLSDVLELCKTQSMKLYTSQKFLLYNSIHIEVQMWWCGLHEFRKMNSHGAINLKHISLYLQKHIKIKIKIKRLKIFPRKRSFLCSTPRKAWLKVTLWQTAPAVMPSH